ncbi:MAG TPA: PEP/pyruvate-binding domain-containing protein [Nitrospirota bacterium]|nr:PEP/pyruvate-binding domain-containing protein [Nitrospirota bacterium]
MKSLASLLSRRQSCLPLESTQGPQVLKYRSFRTFLEHNRAALTVIAELEQIYYSGKPLSLTRIRTRYEWLWEAALGAVASLGAITGKAQPELETVLRALDARITAELEPVYDSGSIGRVLPFEKIGVDSVHAVGAKAAHLARIGNELSLPVPPGFSVTTNSTNLFLKETGLAEFIARQLAQFEPDNLEDVERSSDEIRTALMNAPFPPGLLRELLQAYHDLEAKTHAGVRVAVRSSAVGEDTEATFAGQYETVLNVTEAGLADAYKRVLASKYTSHAITYRLRSGLSDQETPMAVAIVAMINPRSSGVMYTAGAAEHDSDLISINSVWGLAEQLVAGNASPDVLVCDRRTHRITERRIGRRDEAMVNLPQGGTGLRMLTTRERDTASLDDASALRLAKYGVKLEEFFGTPQDVEWALDEAGRLCILQSRPLGIGEGGAPAGNAADIAGYEVLCAKGTAAAPGAASGSVHLLREGAEAGPVPAGAVLVARTASPDLAKYIGSVNGIVTDIGSAASHLASVAREFGVPLIVDAADATATLRDGDIVTMTANPPRVYAGRVNELAGLMRPAKRPVFGSPVHRRLRRALDAISPLNLLDAAAADFSPEACTSVHDVIRYTHERAMQAMFGLTDEADAVRSTKLNAVIPLELRLIDIGGGLKAGLSTCSDITPGDVESAPFRAIWKGFTHPGVSWEGTLGLSPNKLLTRLSSAATSEFGPAPGGTSYAILAADYMNLSVKFGYHFATIDALAGDTSSQNYVSLQFTGGAGSYYGKSLRIAFLGSVLAQLGFQVKTSGDMLEGTITNYDRPSLEDKIDQIGRLLASSRLLDMALSKQEDVERMTDGFFRGEYDYLAHRRNEGLGSFYTHGGLWKRTDDGGQPACMQDGSRAGFTISSGVAGAIGKLAGQALQEFLDNVEAYYYFPLAVKKDLQVADGTMHLDVKPVSGNIDRAGGLIFGMTDVSNYFVLRINALEDNIILFEYVNSRRIERARIRKEIPAGQWYTLGAEIRGNMITGFLNGEAVLDFRADKNVRGYIGLWTKADSVTLFRDLVVDAAGGRISVQC